MIFSASLPAAGESDWLGSVIKAIFRSKDGAVISRMRAVAAVALVREEAGRMATPTPASAMAMMVCDRLRFIQHLNGQLLRTGGLSPGAKNGGGYQGRTIYLRPPRGWVVNEREHVGACGFYIL